MFGKVVSLLTREFGLPDATLSVHRTHPPALRITSPDVVMVRPSVWVLPYPHARLTVVATLTYADTGRACPALPSPFTPRDERRPW